MTRSKACRQTQSSLFNKLIIVSIPRTDRRDRALFACNAHSSSFQETDLSTVKYFLISAPVDWTPDQYIRRFLLPTGEYVSCVLWYVSIKAA